MYFIDTVTLCFLFYTIIFRAWNDILVKTFNKIRNFSLICQLEIWNNLGLFVALDIPDPVHLYQIWYRIGSGNLPGLSNGK